jgi:hypothetical protein
MNKCEAAMQDSFKKKNSEDIISAVIHTNKKKL